MMMTANPRFYAIYMKTNVIRIFNTRTGSLIVPYYYDA